MTRLEGMDAQLAKQVKNARPEKRLAMQVFGHDRLFRWNKDALADAKISPASKDFLSQVGLPSDEDWTFSFGSKDGLLHGHAQRPSLKIVGYDDPVAICIDEYANSRIVAVEPKRTRFINSTISQFGACLALYQTYRQNVRGMDDDEALALIDQIETEMRTVDSAAFENEEFWWPVIVEQMKAGML